MDINLDNIAVELYGKLQTRFPDVKIGSEVAEVLGKKEDIPSARFFEFPYKQSGVTLGTVTIKLDEDDGLVLQVGGDLVDSDVPGIFNFVRSMGRFANSRLLNFKIVNLEKSNLDKRDYEFQAKSKEPEPMEQTTPVMESKFYGTSKISYQDLGEARVVIKHSQPINPELAAGRSMHIESIYVENSQGERFKYPFKHINGARALAEHLKHGGNPYDAIGKHITSLSEELAQLRKFKGYVGRNEALAEAMGDVNGRVMERIEQVKEEVQKLQRKSYYESFAEAFEESATQEIPEAIMDDWIDRLTIRTFNEDLKAAFPYIFKLVSESDIPVKELNPEDMLSELSDDTLKSYTKKAAADMNDKAYAAGHAAAKGNNSRASNNDRKAYKRQGGIEKAVDRLTKEESAFESFVHSITEDEMNQDGHNTLFSPNVAVQHAAIDKLNQIISNELPGGPEGINAIESLKGIIDDPEFVGMLKDLDPDLDARPLIQQYVLSHAPDIVYDLHFGNGQIGGEEPVAPPADLAPAPAPAPEPAPAPAPAPEAGAAPVPPPAPAPVAENTRLKARFIKARVAGATLETVIDFGHRAMTLAEAIDECGMDPAEVGFDQEPEVQQESGVHQILKSIAGFWNKEDKNFTRGGTGIKQMVVKNFKEGEYPNATADDVKQVLIKIEQMDPSSSEKNSVVRLAGLQSAPSALDHEPMDHEEHNMHGIVGDMKTMHNSPQDMMKAIMQKLNIGN